MYCLSRHNTEEVCKDLCQAGIRAGCYHADRLPGDRTRVHTQWLSNSIQARSTTICMCMYGSSFFLGKVTALGVLCCFALFVRLTLLASFFLPSHLSLKDVFCACAYMCDVCTCIIHVHVQTCVMYRRNKTEKLCHYYMYVRNHLYIHIHITM